MSDREIRKIATLDIETDPFLKNRYPYPFAADVFDGDDHYTWWGPQCLDRAIAFLQDKPWVVYAHNGGKFDYHYMLGWLNPGDRVMIINGRLAKFRVGACEFRDSFNVLPVALKEHEKDEIDYALFEAHCRDAHQDEIVSYLHTDTESLYDLITGFIDEYGSHLTQAGAALSFWKKFTSTKIPASDENYYNLFSPYYYGGRVEAISPGIHYGNYMCVDINSAYPFAMRDDHPWGVSYSESWESVKNIERNIHDWKQHFFTVRAVSRGAFPFRDTDTGKLTFPRDGVQREYHVTGWELLAALETETAVIIECRAMFGHMDRISFDDYISYFYDKRLKAKAEKDKKQDIFCKIFMNSLYGKFGANPAEYAEYLISDINTLKRHEFYGYQFAGTLGPNMLVERALDADKRKYYNLATSASITGFVRAFLWRHLCKAETPLYCDTDCIVAASVDVKMSKMLGDWELEGAYDKAMIAGKKMYALRDKETGKWKVRSKGVRFQHEDIEKLCKGGEVVYTSNVPTYSVKKVPYFTSRRIRV